jgi:pre-mRNA-splicing factor SYF1
MPQYTITRTRNAFDHALQALPITQHNRIWPLYIEWAKDIEIPETAVRVFRRYVLIEPNEAEDFIEV